MVVTGPLAIHVLLAICFLTLLALRPPLPHQEMLKYSSGTGIECIDVLQNLLEHVVPSNNLQQT